MSGPPQPYPGQQYGQPQQPFPQQSGQPPQYRQPQYQQPQYQQPPHQVYGRGAPGFGNQSRWNTPQPPAPGFGQPPAGYRQQAAPYTGAPLPQQPGGWQQPAPQAKKSLLPIIILAVVALVAVMAAVSLTRGGGGPGSNTPDYQNDDYQVPAAAGQHPSLPFPDKGQEDQWMQNNKLYGLEMAKPVRCEGLAPVVISETTVDQMEAQLEKELVCLLRVWGPALEQAGFTATHPTVTMYSQPLQTSCGKAATHNAFYCSGDQNLYFATDLHEIFGELGTGNWVYEAVMAHEYAHNIQGRTGILAARYAKLNGETKGPVALLFTRRSEAQADCLAGMFFNSVQQSMKLTTADITQIQNLYGAIGNKDPNELSTHPQPPTRYRWFQTGINTTAIGSCNTFVVAEDEVK